MKTVPSPFNAEQHQSTFDGKKTAEKVYVGATGDMYTIRYMRELGSYLGQTNLSRKNFKVTRIISSFGHKDQISFVSLAHQINDGRTAAYNDNEIVRGVLKAKSPNLRLRNILEIVEGLTLDTSLRFLQAQLEEEMPQICTAK